MRGSRVCPELGNRTNKTRRTAGVNSIRSVYVGYDRGEVSTREKYVSLHYVARKPNHTYIPTHTYIYIFTYGRYGYVSLLEIRGQEDSPILCGPWTFTVGPTIIKMKHEVNYMSVHHTHSKKRSREEIEKMEDDRSEKKRRKLINWKLESNRVLMERAVEEVIATGRSTYVSRKHKIPLRTLRRYTAAERRRRAARRDDSTVENIDVFERHSEEEEEVLSEGSQSPVGDEEFEEFLSYFFPVPVDHFDNHENYRDWEFVPISRVL